MRYENSLIMAEGDMLMLHGRFSGLGLPAKWIVVDIVRIENGLLAEHWDVIEDEVTREKVQPAAFQCSARRFPPDNRFRKALTMKDAKTLLLEFLAAVTHRPKRRRLVRRGRGSRTAVPAFAGHPLAPPRSTGDQRAPEFSRRALSDFAFKPEDTHVLIDTPEQVFAEYMAHRRRGRPGAPSITCLPAVS